jgi:hypothetical protein
MSFTYKQEVKGNLSRYFFQFTVAEVEYGKWRIYIDYAPNLVVNGHLYHIYSDGAGRYFICWSEDILSDADAIAILKVWCKKYVNQYEKDYGSNMNINTYKKELNRMVDGTFRSLNYIL